MWNKLLFLVALCIIWENILGVPFEDKTKNNRTNKKVEIGRNKVKIGNKCRIRCLLSLRGVEEAAKVCSQKCHSEKIAFKGSALEFGYYCPITCLLSLKGIEEGARSWGPESKYYSVCSQICNFDVLTAAKPTYEDGLLGELGDTKIVCKPVKQLEETSRELPVNLILQIMAKCVEDVKIMTERFMIETGDGKEDTSETKESKRRNKVEERRDKEELEIESKQKDTSNATLQPKETNESASDEEESLIRNKRGGMKIYRMQRNRRPLKVRRPFQPAILPPKTLNKN